MLDGSESKETPGLDHQAREAELALKNIQERVRRWDAVRELTAGPLPLEDDKKFTEMIELLSRMGIPEEEKSQLLQSGDSRKRKILEGVLGRRTGRQSTRSENFVEEEQINSINKIVDKVREIIFAQGQDMESWPDFQLWLDDGYEITPEEARKKFWIDDGEYRLWADKEDLKDFSSPGGRLELEVDDQHHTFAISFTFDGEFNLEVGFLNDQGRIAERYGSGGPMNEMSIEDYEIMRYYLNRYIVQSEAKSPQ